jgi:peptide/nickel transport system permease protein/peptide/nickel transport system substrate-binding protein
MVMALSLMMIALVCVMVIPATRGSAAAPTTTLTAGTPQGPNSFDPCANGGGASIPFLDLLYAGLIFEVPSTGQLVPGLASSWGFSANKLTFTMTIKPGYTFQDGTPVNAQAAVTSLEYCLSEKVQTLPTVTSITATGTYTLQFDLSAPTASLPAELSEQLGMLISPAAIAKYGVSGLGSHPVGAGPFTLTSYVPNSSVDFAAWPGYVVAGEPAPQVGHIDVQIITDQTSLVSALETGTVDYAFATDPSIVPEVKGDSSLHVHINTAALAVTAMFINFKVKPMNIVDVRLALEYALNRTALSKGASDGVFDTPAYSVYGPKSPFYDTSTKNLWPFSIKKAKQLLKAAGYPHGITINGALSIAASPFEQDAVIAAAQWKKAGITVNFTEDQPTTALTQFARPRGGTMFSVGWDGTPTVASTYYGLFASTSSTNPAHVANPAIQKDLTALNSAYTPAAVAKIQKSMDSVIDSQALWIPLWYNPFPEVYSTSVTGALQASSVGAEPDMDYLSVS